MRTSWARERAAALASGRAQPRRSTPAPTAALVVAPARSACARVRRSPLIALLQAAR